MLSRRRFLLLPLLAVPGAAGAAKALAFDTLHASIGVLGVKSVVGRLQPRHNVWDSAILVPVEDVWAMHGMPTGHRAGDARRIGPPW